MMLGRELCGQLWSRGRPAPDRNHSGSEGLPIVLIEGRRATAPAFRVRIVRSGTVGRAGDPRWPPQEEDADGPAL